MATISQNLAQLKQDREDLIDNLETQGITGLTGNETFTELVPEVLNISGGDVKDYFTDKISKGSTIYAPGIISSIKKIPTLTADGTSLENAFSNCTSLTTIPLLDTSSVTNMRNMFYSCYRLTTIPLLDTSSVMDMYGMFYSCAALTTIPLLDTSSVTNMGNMFFSCTSLTTIPLLDTSSVTYMSSMFFTCGRLTTNSLNNILAMCAGATNYTGTKSLSDVFGTSMGSVYPSATIQALSNYQDFVDAGWTIGWS